MKNLKDYAKFIAAIVGFALTSATATFDSVPVLVTYIAGLITTIAVYFVRNGEAVPDAPATT